MKNPGRWHCLCGHPYDLAYETRSGTIWPALADAKPGAPTAGRSITLCQTCGRNLSTLCYLRRTPPSKPRR